MLYLRQAEYKDIPSILSIYRPSVEETTASFEYVLPTVEQFKTRFDGITVKHPFFVCVDDAGGKEQVVGYAYCSDAFERRAFSWNAEISIYIDDQHQGHGIGKAFAYLCEEVMKEEGYVKVYSLVSGENVQSIAFHKSLNYSLLTTLKNTGNKYGRWVDLLWYEKDIAPFVSSPAFPKKYCELSLEVKEQLLAKATARIKQ